MFAGSRGRKTITSQSQESTRRSKTESFEEDKAAVKIQALWRGKQDREEFLKKQRALRNEAEPAEPAHWCYGEEVQQLRKVLYLLLEEPQSSKMASLISMGILTVIVFSIACFILETMPELRGPNGEFKDELWGSIEVFCTCVFTVEYLTRLWVSDAMGGSMKDFLVEPMNIADLFAVAPFYITLLMTRISSGGNSFRMLRAIRLARITRVVKLGKYSSGMRLMGEALRNSLQAIWVLCFLISIAVVLFSSLLFYAEKSACPDLEEFSADQRAVYASECSASIDGFSKAFGLCCDEHGSPLDFPSIIHACWWSVVTMTTVGFGEIYPRTWKGRLVGTGAMLMGILIIALPVAIVGRRFQEVYDKYTADRVANQLGDGVVNLLRSKQGPGLNLDNLVHQHTPFTGLGMKMKQLSVKKEREGLTRELLDECGILADTLQAAEEQQASMYRVEVIELYRQDELYQRFDIVLDRLAKAKRKLKTRREQAQNSAERFTAQLLSASNDRG